MSEEVKIPQIMEVKTQAKANIFTNEDLNFLLQYCFTQERTTTQQVQIKDRVKILDIGRSPEESVHKMVETPYDDEIIKFGPAKGKTFKWAARYYQKVCYDALNWGEQRLPNQQDFVRFVKQQENFIKDGNYIRALNSGLAEWAFMHNEFTTIVEYPSFETFEDEFRKRGALISPMIIYGGSNASEMYSNLAFECGIMPHAHSNEKGPKGKFSCIALVYRSIESKHVANELY